ncbi:unnamed protein product [Cuscuta epithymum]|uniref:RNase H type-1 domain-containing protein n=1 Tax=Cuscuta epithymum TaxID=186058 RepID=A0AAV0FNK6_9ASTE|nr:unnamed protein product [Cuscuta epithymum]
MRNHEGELVFAISFPVIASSSVEAEILSIILATTYAIQIGFSDFLVESDSTVALSYILEGGRGRWMDAIKEMILISFRKSISFGSVMREGNWAAHHLAAQSITQWQFFQRACDLPGPVKQAYYADYFGLSNFRYN